jgi:transposase
MDLRPVAGIDVSKDFSDMCILSSDNSIYAELKIYHDHTSMSLALEKLAQASLDLGCTPILVMESTAHYHKVLAQFFSSNGLEVLVINPIQSGALKNMYVRRIKNDKVDAHRIALLYRLKILHSTNQLSDLLSDIRDLCRRRKELKCDFSAYSNKLLSLLDQAFPKYHKIFSRVTSPASLAILQAYPTPDDVLAAGARKISRTMAKHTGRKPDSKYITKKIKALFAVAPGDAQINIKRDSFAILITSIVKVIEQLDASIKSLEVHIERLAQMNDVLNYEINLLQSIPGVGRYAATALRAEIGDFSSFSKSKQLVAFFGLDPSTKESGKLHGASKLSKRGSPYARAILAMCVQAAICKRSCGQPLNPVLSLYYAKKLDYKKPKVARCAIMRKMVDIIFAVLRDQQPFELRTPEEHIELMHQNCG